MEVTLYAVVITRTVEVKNHHINNDDLKGWTLRNEHVHVEQLRACLSVVVPMIFGLWDWPMCAMTVTDKSMVYFSLGN